MAYRSPDRAQEKVTGTTTLALSGLPSSRTYRTLDAAGIASGDCFPGVLMHRTQRQWQSGLWRRSGSTIVLTRFHASSAGSQISFSAGTKDIAVTSLGRSASPLVITPALSPFDMLPGDDLHVDTSDGPVTLRLWTSPVQGEPRARIVDAAGTWDANALTISAGDALFEDGLSDTLVCDAPAEMSIYFHADRFRVR